jgi:hypothetical protein
VRPTRATLLAAALLCACGDDTGQTGVDLVIRYDPHKKMDHVALTASAGSEELIRRTLLPEEDRPLSEGGREGVVLLLPDDVAGGEVTIRVDGLDHDKVVVAGEVSVGIALGELAAAELRLVDVHEDCDDEDGSDEEGPCPGGPGPG